MGTTPSSPGKDQFFPKPLILFALAHRRLLSCFSFFSIADGLTDEVFGVGEDTSAPRPLAEELPYHLRRVEVLSEGNRSPCQMSPLAGQMGKLRDLLDKV